ncbi:uncharacterized protein [Miscanthus floridulus]|uniref:uncharacterized protein n=1 Tax=Miscanthus floridulus TaxID=154761 RepID=UPI00345AE381
MAGGDGRPGSSVHPQSLPFGMPGYGGLPSASSSGSAIVHPTMASRPVPITQISFPPSPSPLPAPFNTPVYPAVGDPEDGGAVPRFHKFTFPTFDGKADPLDWLNKCDHFFRAQRTREADKVWLASFHMTGVAQYWYYMFERDEGGVAAVSWERFRAMCQQRFAPPPLGTNHLSDLARLPFRCSIDDYTESFLARLAHAGVLVPIQQVQLYTGGRQIRSGQTSSCRCRRISNAR